MKFRADSRLPLTFKHDRVMPGHLLVWTVVCWTHLSTQHSNTRALITLPDYPSLLEIIFWAINSWVRELPLFTSRNSKKITSDSIWAAQASDFAELSSHWLCCQAWIRKYISKCLANWVKLLPVYVQVSEVDREHAWSDNSASTNLVQKNMHL